MHSEWYMKATIKLHANEFSPQFSLLYLACNPGVRIEVMVCNCHSDSMKYSSTGYIYDFPVSWGGVLLRISGTPRVTAQLVPPDMFTDSSIFLSVYIYQFQFSTIRASHYWSAVSKTMNCRPKILVAQCYVLYH